MTVYSFTIVLLRGKKSSIINLVSKDLKTLSFFCLKVFFKTENEYNNNRLARWILKQLNNLYFSTISEPLNVTFTHLV